MNSLNFTDVDLEANRRGVMSDRQQGLIANVRRNIIRGCVMIAAIWAVFFIVIGIRANVIIPALIAMLVADALTGFWFYGKWQKVVRDWASGHVASIEGEPKLSGSLAIGTSTFSARIGGVPFVITKDAFRLLQNSGGRYRAYYMAQSNVLLSLEPSAGA